MMDWFTDLAQSLSETAWLQGLLAAFCTFVFEDPTTVGCGLLVADGKMGGLTALLGVALGIAVGDVGLYGLGRLLGPKTVKWGLMAPERLERARVWMENHLVLSVLGARFLPGMRLPVFLGAGMFKASFRRYALVVLMGSFLWTLLLLYVAVQVGSAVLPLLGVMKWPVLAGFLVFLVFINRKIARRRIGTE